MAIFDVIKFDGNQYDKWVVYKFSGNEFNTKSKLIVGVGQVAIAVHGGQVERIFESGTYQLDTENLPYLKGFVKSIHGGNNPYQMEIYFINKTIKLDMLWGTNDPIQLIDPRFNVKVRVRARGQFGIRIANYQFFLTVLVGSVHDNNMVTFNVIQDYFRGLINTKVKTTIGEYVIKKDVSIMDISVFTEEIADTIKDRLDEEFTKFGMEIINFYIESINVPESDMETINGILNKKAEFDIMGDHRYKTARGYDVLEAAASNEGGAGGIAAAGVGLGLGLGAAKSAGNLSGDIIPNQTGVKTCPNCGSAVGNAKFCPDCGEKIKVTCPSCNVEIQNGKKFCPDCGTKLK